MTILPSTKSSQSQSQLPVDPTRRVPIHSIDHNPVTTRRISNLSSSDSPRNPNPQDGCSGEDLEASRRSARGTRRVVLGLGESDHESVL